MKLRILSVVIVIAIVVSSESHAQDLATGKKLLWAGVTMLGGGVAATVYGAHARTILVPRYTSVSPSATVTSVSVATVTSSMTTSTTASFVCSSIGAINMPCPTSSTSTLTGYVERKGTKWGIVAPALGTVLGGTVFAILGKRRMKIAEQQNGWKLAMTGAGGAVSYTWK